MEMEPSNTSTPVSKTRFLDYLPLLLILVFSFLEALAFSQRMIQFNGKGCLSAFMGLFFMHLSLFKLFDLKGFVSAFSVYDFPTQKLRFYGYLYPFIEFCLGWLYLSSWMRILTHILTILIMGVSAFGVLRAIFKGQASACACMGTSFKVPLTVVSVIENLGMGLMALFMLF